MAPLVEILMFAVLTFYLLFKLWHVLGTRTGNEKTSDSSQNTVIDFPTSSRMKEVVIEAEFAPPIQEAILKLQKTDPSFSPIDFLDGARTAFQLVTEAFGKGDISTLRTLLVSSVFEQFKKVIQDRETQGHSVEMHLEKIDHAELVEIAFENQMVRIQVRFVSDQLIITRDKDNLILDNPLRIANRLTDIWTFERNVKSSDDFWLLAGTRSQG